jgi:HD-GYP domain-containing protein (c-di-GMP phosphodiesterase class II)
MFSILDILKKHSEEKKKLKLQRLAGESVKREEKEDLENKLINENETKNITESLKISGVSVSGALDRGIVEENIKLTGELYDETLVLAKKLYCPELESAPDLKLQINSLIEKMVSLLSRGNRESLQFCLSDYSKEEDYLYCHVVNVCLMSIEIGLGLGYDRLRLVELGTASFLHDIGITKYLEIINKSEKLTEEDYNKVKQHPNYGVEILNKLDKEFPAVVFDVVSQEHERMDGSGYPKGLKNGEIAEYAQIVGLIDVYEAMIHRRPYRSKHTFSETMNMILNKKNAFGYKMIKILIERIGIFPLGSLVRLNTQEIGMVFKDNLKSPLRPVVNIIYDPSGKQLKQPKQIDLASNTVIYIEECLDCLKSPNKGQ